MNDQTAGSDSINPQLNNVVVAEILNLKMRAEEAASAAEEANRKANSESGFAFNAKQNAEDHARAIAQVRGSVEADFNWLTTTKKNADEAAEAILTAKRAAESGARSAGEAKLAAEAEVAAIRSTKDKAEASVLAIEKAREENALFAKRAGEDAAAVTQARANSEASASAVQALQGQVSEAAARMQADGTAIADRNTESKSLLASMTEVTETAQASHARVRAYEDQLKHLSSDIAGLHTKIEALLPGATSAGLASAFRDQKGRFDRPQWIWLTTFIVAIVILFVVGALGWRDLVNDPMTWDSIRRHVVSRLPIAVPPVWLALYAGRNYMLALRLQEDYAYKEAISTAFEGYRREMTSIPVNDSQMLPVLTLCDNVLRTLGQRPGRLYDGKHEDVTPLTPVTKLVKDVFQRSVTKETEA